MNNEVVEMKRKNGKTKVTDPMLLNNDERMELENIHLKRLLLEKQAEQHFQELDARYNNILKKISDRLGFDLTGYNINLETGAINKPEEK